QAEQLLLQVEQDLRIAGQPLTGVVAAEPPVECREGCLRVAEVVTDQPQGNPWVEARRGGHQWLARPQPEARPCQRLPGELYARVVLAGGCDVRVPDDHVPGNA